MGASPVDVWAGTKSQGERKRGGEGRLLQYVWRAPGIKQVFEKGRQREKVSAKYLKEC